MIKNFCASANFHVFEASCHYFSSISELTSNETTIKVKLIAALKIASFATLIAPLFLGVSYLVNKSLHHRAQKLNIKRNGCLQDRLDQISSKPTKSSIKTDHIGAGILPYCIREDGKAYFMMAKEAKGYAKNTWCDFGGGADPGESRIVTAVREGWEESGDLLGSMETIYRNVQRHDPLTLGSGEKNYAMFLMEVNEDDIDFEAHSTRTACDGCRVEKSDFAWVKAQDIFQAVQQGNSRVKLDNGKSIRLRRCFSDTIQHALNDNTQKALLKRILGQENLIASVG